MNARRNSENVKMAKRKKKSLQKHLQKKKRKKAKEAADEQKRYGNMPIKA